MRPTTMHHRAFALLAALTVSGCGSTFEGTKLSENGKISETSSTSALSPEFTGIPFTLTAPEYTLTSGPDPSDPTKIIYSIVVAYVPDPAQTYSLRVNPAHFSDIDFLMKFREDGSLEKTSNSSTDKIVPAITSVGSFALATASLIGVLALDDTGSAATKSENAVSQADSANVPQKNSARKYVILTQENPKEDMRTFPAQLKEKLELGNLTCDESPPTNFPTTDSLYKRVSKYVGKDETENDALQTRFFKEFHYLDTSENKCLTKVSSAAAEQYVSDWKVFKIDINKAQVNSQSTNTKAEMEAFEAIDNAKKKLLDDISTILENSGNEGSLIIADKLANLLNQLNATIQETALTDEQKESINLNLTVKIENQSQKFLEKAPIVFAPTLADIIEMPYDQWRARHIAFLDQLIQDEKFSTALKGLNPDNPEDVSNIEQKYATGTEGKIGALTNTIEPRWILGRLELKLKDPPPIEAPRTGTLSIYEEYARMNAEAARLRTVIVTSKADALKPLKTAKPTGAKITIKTQTVFPVSKTELDRLTKTSNATIMRNGKVVSKIPDYVVYLQPLKPNGYRIEEGASQ